MSFALKNIVCLNTANLHKRIRWYLYYSRS